MTSPSPLLLIADHASNAVPEGIELGVPLSALAEHVAYDIGVAALADAIGQALACPCVLGSVSRLVIDLNRELDSPALIPSTSDGIEIIGNKNLSEEERYARIETWWRPFHEEIAARIATQRPRMLISLHSFTPRLATSEEARPWEIGILHNRDDRAARPAIAMLEAKGIVTGNNLPYSGKVLNSTMNMHAEANGIPYLGIEIRQDLVGSQEGVDRWAPILIEMIAWTAQALA